MRLRVVLACLLAPLVLWTVLPLSSTGAPSRARVQELEKKLSKTRKKIGAKKGTERLLTSEVQVYSKRIGRLQGRIGGLQQRERALRTDLDAKRAELVRVQDRLRAERARLARLRTRLVVSRRMLEQRLVELYKADQPDLLTVVLNAKDFSDLFQRGEVLRRISDADRRIVTEVKRAKRDATSTSKRLAKLERRKQVVAAAILQRRQQVSEVKGELIGTRVGYAKTRSDKANALDRTRADRKDLEQHADELEAASAKAQAALAGIAARGSSGGSALPAGPIKSGGGQWIFPVSGPITGQFGEQRPGHLHAGIDIAAAEGTPIRAADNGKVVLLQGVGASGGYGNYTCVQHSGSLASCYAHQVRFGTSMGANVRKGQVIGFVGNTGHSFGAHLHFEARVNGTPVSPYNYL